MSGTLSRYHPVQVGSISIGSIYAALALSALFAPVVIRRLGERLATTGLYTRSSP
jgi:hypothetical protein